MAPLLLTGASGYLGAAIGVALRERGIAYAELPGRLEHLEKHALRGYRQVIHAAGALRTRGALAVDLSTRIGTARLLAALDGTAEILFISSRAVYGHRPGGTCSEDDPPLPADNYAVAKLAAERAIQESGLPHAILRIPRLIGDSPAGIGHGFYAEALRRFLAGKAVVRYLPDRLDDSLDVRALADLCADWAGGARRLPGGVTNVTGAARSLHATLADFAAVAERFGGRANYLDREYAGVPWPLLSDRRLRRAVGGLASRSDTEIAVACCAMLVGELP